MPKECVIGTETQVLCWHCYQIISDFTQPLTQAFQTSLSTYINTITTACKLYVVILTKPLSYPLGYLSAHFETKMRQKRLWHQLPPSLSPADPGVSTGRFPPSVPSSLPSHVLSHVVTSLLRPPTAQVTCRKESWQINSEANKDTNGLLQTARTRIRIHYLSFSATHKSLSLSRRCALVTGVTVPSHRPSGLAASAVETVRGQ